MCWQPTAIHTLEDVEMPVYQRLPEDALGQSVIERLEDCLGSKIWRTRRECARG